MTMRTQAYPKKKESVIKNSAINLTLLQHNGDKKKFTHAAFAPQIKLGLHGCSFLYTIRSPQN